MKEAGIDTKIYMQKLKDEHKQAFDSHVVLGGDVVGKDVQKLVLDGLAEYKDVFTRSTKLQIAARGIDLSANHFATYGADLDPNDKKLDMSGAMSWGGRISGIVDAISRTR